MTPVQHAFRFVFTLVGMVLLFVVVVYAYITIRLAEHRYFQQQLTEQVEFGSFAPKPKTKKMDPLPAKLKVTNLVSEQGAVLGGTATGPGIAIDWYGAASANGAIPVDVLKVTAQRLSHLQSTPQANNGQAKALFAVLEAIDYLEGSDDVSAPVGPGFAYPNGDLE
jgi:hypothetical protein